MMSSAREAPAGRRYGGMTAEERVRTRRVAILAAALELFGTNGFAATSVKQICAHAGLTERYFYESFRDRQACLVEVYGMLVAELRATTQTAVDRAGSDLDAAAAGGLSAFVGYLTDDPRRAQVVLIEVVGVSPEIEELRHGVLREFAELIVSGWARRPVPDPGDERARLTAVALSGAVNNLLVDWMLTGTKQSPELLVDVCVTLFAAALAGLDGSG